MLSGGGRLSAIVDQGERASDQGFAITFSYHPLRRRGEALCACPMPAS